MRQYFSIALAALSFVLAFGASADESGAPRHRARQHYVNVGNDQDGGDYQYPQEDSNIPIQNNGYAINSGEFLVPGAGLPTGFVCSMCAVIQSPGWPNSFSVVAQNPGGLFFLLGGPVPGGITLVSLVNSIKMQTGMCQNLPFIRVGPVGFGGCGGGCGGGVVGGGVGISPGIPPMVGGPGMRPPMWGGGGLRPTPYNNGQMPMQMPANPGMYGGGMRMGAGGYGQNFR